MTNIQHHISDDILEDYRAGTLPHAFCVVVARAMRRTI
jgi:putative transcriptional regulator